MSIIRSYKGITQIGTLRLDAEMEMEMEYAEDDPELVSAIKHMAEHIHHAQETFMRSQTTYKMYTEYGYPPDTTPNDSFTPTGPVVDSTLEPVEQEPQHADGHPLRLNGVSVYSSVPLVSGHCNRGGCL